MVRIWRLTNGGGEEEATSWLGEIEHLQSGEHWSFETLDELPELLRRQAEALQPG
jgi:hypothetical protein